MFRWYFNKFKQKEFFLPKFRIISKILFIIYFPLGYKNIFSYFDKKTSFTLDSDYNHYQRRQSRSRKAKYLWICRPCLFFYLLCFVNIVLPVTAICAGLIIRDLSAYTSALVIYCMGFPSRPVDQHRRRLTERVYSICGI